MCGWIRSEPAQAGTHARVVIGRDAILVDRQLCAGSASAEALRPAQCGD